jgi:hypothetical protein
MGSVKNQCDLFPLLRHLVDQHPQTQYLIFGSASEELIERRSPTFPFVFEAKAFELP